jgi:hypothetical protein
MKRLPNWMATYKSRLWGANYRGSSSIGGLRLPMQMASYSTWQTSFRSGVLGIGGVGVEGHGEVNRGGRRMRRFH